MLEQIILKFWYQPYSDLSQLNKKEKLIFYFISIILYPVLFILSFIYKIIIYIKSIFYRLNILKAYKSKHPIVVVGNITTGGTGKTQVVIKLAQILSKNNIRVAVILRGYKSKINSDKNRDFILVDNTTDTKLCGDEAKVIYNCTGCVVIAGANRVKAIQYLEKNNLCDVIISDDGLQNYSFNQDYKICVVDGSRWFGNGYLIPLGPLRESISNIENYDCVLVKQSLGCADISSPPSYAYPPAQAALDRGVQSSRDNSGYRGQAAVRMGLVTSSLAKTNLHDKFKNKYINNYNNYFNFQVKAQGVYYLNNNTLISNTELANILDNLDNQNIYIYSGIGNNKSYELLIKDYLSKIINKNKLNNINICFFNDHYNYKLSDFDILNNSNNNIIITTQKDAVKINDLLKSDVQNNLLNKIYYMKTDIELDDEYYDNNLILFYNKFFKNLQTKINSSTVDYAR